MEDFPHEVEDLEQTGKSRRWRRVEFLASWLSRRKEADQIAHEASSKDEVDDEESDETEDRPRRWRKTLRRMLSSVGVQPVERTTSTVTDASERKDSGTTSVQDSETANRPEHAAPVQSGVEADATAQPDQLQPAEFVHQDSREYQGELVIDHGQERELADEPESDRHEVIDLMKDTAHVETPTDIPGSSSPETVHEPALTSSAYRIYEKREPEESATPPISLPPVYRSPDAYVPYILPVSDHTERLPADRAISDTSTHTERVVERPTGAAAVGVLLGAEHIGRKRADKKLRNELLDLKREVLSNDASLLQTAEVDRRSAVSRTDYLNQQSTGLEQRVRTLEAPRASVGGSAERPILAPIERTVSDIRPAETKLAANGERQVESEQALVSLARPEQMNAVQAEKAVRPEAIFEKVAVAAEHDEPIERSYELRHEVKDEPSVVTGLTPIGALVPQSAAAYQVGHASNGTLPPVSTGGTWFDPIKDRFKPQDDNMMYKQAAVNGFVGAMVIIVLAVLAYLAQ